MLSNLSCTNDIILKNLLNWRIIFTRTPTLNRVKETLSKSVLEAFTAVVCIFAHKIFSKNLFSTRSANRCRCIGKSPLHSHAVFNCFLIVKCPLGCSSVFAFAPCLECLEGGKFPRYASRLKCSQKKMQGGANFQIFWDKIIFIQVQYSSTALDDHRMLWLWQFSFHSSARSWPLFTIQNLSIVLFMLSLSCSLTIS